MKLTLLSACFVVQIYLYNCGQVLASNNSIPLVLVTWDFHDAAQKAYDVLYKEKRSALDAIEAGCTVCEEQRCMRTVGYGGSPDESGDTTLDAMIMDGVTMDVGGVGVLRNVRNVISVARKVLHYTKHSLLGGELATEFALQMGFKQQSLQTAESKKMWIDWKSNSCQPNYWKNVAPSPAAACGPYLAMDIKENTVEKHESLANERNHDTISIVAIDSNGHIAAGTSTNGAAHKIPGRIGDSPIPGAGAYADQEVGAAAATGDGDVMMRFVPTFLAVEEMRRGASPSAAVNTAIRRIAKHYPNFFGAVMAINKNGEYAAACSGMESFPHFVGNPKLGRAVKFDVKCIDSE